MAHGGGAGDLESRLIARLRALHPFAWCDACLAVIFAVSEDEMRAAAVAAVGRHAALARERRACYACQRTTELTALR